MAMQQAYLLVTFALVAATTAHPVMPEHKVQQFSKELRHDLKLPGKDEGALAAEKSLKSGHVAHSASAKSSKPLTKPVELPVAKPAAPAKAVKNVHPESTKAVSKQAARSTAKAPVVPAHKLKKFANDLRHDLSKITSENKKLAAEEMPKSGKKEASVTKSVGQSSPQSASIAPTKAFNVAPGAKASNTLARETNLKSHIERPVESMKPVTKPVTKASAPAATTATSAMSAQKLQQSVKDSQHGADKLAHTGKDVMVSQKKRNSEEPAHLESVKPVSATASKSATSAQAVKPSAHTVEHAAKALATSKPATTESKASKVLKAAQAATPAPKSAHPTIKAASAAPVAAKQKVAATKSAQGFQPSTGAAPVKISGTKSNPFKFATNFLRKQADACQCQFKGTCSCDSTMEFMDCISAACASGKCDCHALQYQHACVDMAGTCTTLGFECKTEKAVCVSELESDRKDIKPPKEKTTAEIYDDLRKLKEDKCRFEMATEDGWLNSQTQLNIAEKQIRSLLADLVGRGERQPEMHCGKHFDEKTIGLEGSATRGRGGLVLLVAMAFIALLS